ncbi:MAG: type II toxin-antitoxin system VapC family toxin [Planctomycetes bacterium]|nr:type II toxin-antitoxin system VapC family toxin [Planctomycetota bacterium]
MDASLLDTDILSEVLRQRNAAVVQKSADYLRIHGQFAFSVFTRFEIVRGYKEQGAARQLARFAALCQKSLVLPLTDAIFDRAADLWVLARRGGHPHGDADLFIAATALEHGRTLATGNTAHFAWIPALTLEDWRQP